MADAGTAPSAGAGGDGSGVAQLGGAGASRSRCTMRRISSACVGAAHLLPLLLVAATTKTVHAGASSPPIYVINLARSPGRWEKVAEQLKDQGLSGSRLEAVDGRTLAKADLKRVTTPLASKLLPRGVIGCFLSHVLFWELVTERGHACAIVLEDDCELQPDFAASVAAVVEELPATWDVCLLGALGCAEPDGRHGLLNELCAWYMGGTRRCRRLSRHVFVPHKPAGTHAYLISASGAKKLLHLLTRATYHVDFVAWHSALGLELYAAHPFAAYQDVQAVSTLVMAQVESEGAAKRKKKRAEKALSPPRAKPGLLARREVGGGTRQSWAHVFAEPMLQLPYGPLITVGRHQLVVTLGLIASAVMMTQPAGTVYRCAGRAVLCVTGALIVLVWLTVRYLVHQAIGNALRSARLVRRGRGLEVVKISSRQAVSQPV